MSITEEPPLSVATPLCTETPVSVILQDGSHAARGKRGQRKPGLLQGMILTSVSTLSVMGIILLTPVLPLMDAQFADVPGSEALVRIALTVPAFCVFLFSPLAGFFTDRFSRRRILLGSMVVYAVFGTAPFYLDSLWAIIATRVGVGLAEAALMTASTTLIGDLFDGQTRERWFAAQTGVASTSAILLFAIGGALGDYGWRVPFLVYGVSLVLFLLVLLFTAEPSRRQDGLAAAETFPWAATRGIFAMTAFASLVFYIIPIQLPFILVMHGITLPSQIGLATAIGAMAVPLGSGLFAWKVGLSLRLLLAVGFTFAGAGLLGVVYSSSYELVLVGVVLNQFGCGLYLPALLTWSVAGLPFSLRGRGSGIWMSCFFLGQSVSPLVVMGVAAAVGGLLPGVTALSVVCLLGATGAIAWPRGAGRLRQA